jgi:hypothetical protein
MNVKWRKDCQWFPERMLRPFQTAFRMILPIDEILAKLKRDTANHDARMRKWMWKLWQ